MNHLRGLILSSVPHDIGRLVIVFSCYTPDRVRLIDVESGHPLPLWSTASPSSEIYSGYDCPAFHFLC